MIGFAVLVVAVSFGLYITISKKPVVPEEMGVSVGSIADMAAAERYPNQILWNDFPVRGYLGRDLVKKKLS